MDLLLRVWVAIVHPGPRSEAGQSTAEYALVMIAAAAVAGLALMWVHNSDIVGKLFGGVLKKILPF